MLLKLFNELINDLLVTIIWDLLKFFLMFHMSFIPTGYLELCVLKDTAFVLSLNSKQIPHRIL